jgi:hypothetical protein
MSKFKVYRVIEERVKHKDPVFYIEKYHWLWKWRKLTERHWTSSGDSTYVKSFPSNLKAHQYIETNFMKPEIIHHLSYYIAK